MRVLSHDEIEYAGENAAAMLDLDPDSICACSRKNVREAELPQYWHSMWHGVAGNPESPLRGRITTVAEREHVLRRKGDRAGGMEVNED